ncbi:hypothetical protein [Desulfobotulus mexicanus]|uniref:hypothetical protein n=1 Tax=Desulfobotulus mexicanus TaxID=2586642 RepID=UPI0015D35ABC|nr:hypothetical protein [Desulfobotulus mexicanus]
MKIDMSSKAITERLKTVNQLRKACLALARTSIGKKIIKEHASNESVQKTSLALGR